MLPEEPTEALKLTVLPLRKETTLLSESVRDLKNDALLEELEADPTETVKVMLRPLDSELARPRELVRDLKLEVFSLKLGVEEKRPARDLNMESLSTNTEAAETVALIVLKSENR